MESADAKQTESKSKVVEMTSSCNSVETFAVVPEVMVNRDVKRLLNADVLVGRGERHQNVGGNQRVKETDSEIGAGSMKQPTSASIPDVRMREDEGERLSVDVNVRNRSDLDVGTEEMVVNYGSDEASSLLPVDRQGKRPTSTLHTLNLREQPTDRWSLVFFIFFLIGVSTLLPWNFFISLSAFWNYKFREVNGTNLKNGNGEKEEKTELQEEFTSYLAIASNIPNAIFVILNAIYGQKIGLRKRIVATLSAIIGLFTAVTAFAMLNSDQWQETFLLVVLTLVVLINVNTAIFQGAVFGMAGKFPLKYMGITMLGQSVGGVFPALVEIMVAALDIEEKDVGFFCFLVATLVLALVLVAFVWVAKAEFFCHFADQDSFGNSSSDRSMSRTWHALHNSWHYCLSIYLTFAVTLSVFPALTVLVESQFKGTLWAKKYFDLVCNFLLFNTGDCIGRYLANLLQVPGRSPLGMRITLAASLGRILFIPLFLYCNSEPEERTATVFFPLDAEFVVIMILFSISNGYLGNICMLHGPKMESDGTRQEATAMVLVACLVLGTGSGSALSLPVLKLV